MIKEQEQRPTKRRRRYAAQLRENLEQQDVLSLLTAADAIGLDDLTSQRHHQLIDRIVTARLMGKRAKMPRP